MSGCEPIADADDIEMGAHCKKKGGCSSFFICSSSGNNALHLRAIRKHYMFTGTSRSSSVFEPHHVRALLKGSCLRHEMGAKHYTIVCNVTSKLLTLELRILCS